MWKSKINTAWPELEKIFEGEKYSQTKSVYHVSSTHCRGEWPYSLVCFPVYNLKNNTFFSLSHFGSILQTSISWPSFSSFLLQYLFHSNISDRGQSHLFWRSELFFSFFYYFRLFFCSSSQAKQSPYLAVCVKMCVWAREWERKKWGSPPTRPISASRLEIRANQRLLWAGQYWGSKRYQLSFSLSPHALIPPVKRGTFGHVARFSRLRRTINIENRHFFIFSILFFFN